MQELTIAMALIEQGNSYVLQRRGSNPQIGAAGLLGCFGGKVETGEDPLHAIAREISEETNLKPPESAFVELGLVEVISDYKGEAMKIHGHSYRLSLELKILIDAYEGELVALQKSKARDILSEMTPGTRAIFEQYIIPTETQV
jgi:ADP-ribose pyrophosphatase YjhB (NUDIX family)